MEPLLLFFILAPLFDLAVVGLLFKAWRAGKNSVLWERLITASALFLSTSLTAALALNRLFNLHVTDDSAVVILTAALLATTVPSINWLYMFIKNKF